MACVQTIRIGMKSTAANLIPAKVITSGGEKTSWVLPGGWGQLAGKQRAEFLSAWTLNMAHSLIIF
jgi:hypothetical protein